MTSDRDETKEIAWCHQRRENWSLSIAYCVFQTQAVAMVASVPSCWRLRGWFFLSSYKTAKTIVIVPSLSCPGIKRDKLAARGAEYVLGPSPNLCSLGKCCSIKMKSPPEIKEQSLSVRAQNVASTRRCEARVDVLVSDTTQTDSFVRTISFTHTKRAVENASAGEAGIFERSLPVTRVVSDQDYQPGGDCQFFVRSRCQRSKMSK